MVGHRTRVFLNFANVATVVVFGACANDFEHFSLNDGSGPDSVDGPVRDAGLPMDGNSDGQGEASIPDPPTLPQPGDAWRQFGHDAMHANRSRATVGTAPKVLWKAAIDESAYYLAPVIDEQNHIYVSTYKHLYAFSPTGELRWKAGHPPPEVGYYGFVGVAVQEDGSVVASFADGFVRGYSVDGTELFAADLGLEFPYSITSPTLDSDGMIYVAGITDTETWSPIVFALRSNGEIVWSTLLDEQAENVNAIAIDANHSLYVSFEFGSSNLSFDNGHIVKLNDKGVVSWSAAMKSAPCSPAISLEGDVWFPAIGDPINGSAPKLYGYSSEGMQRAAMDLHYVPQGPVAIDLNANVYVGTAGGLQAFDRVGQKLWQVWGAEPPNWSFHIWSRSAVDAAGTVVISDDAGAIRGIRKGVVLFNIVREGFNPGLRDSVAIGPDGTIYAGSGDNYLYAIR